MQVGGMEKPEPLNWDFFPPFWERNSVVLVFLVCNLRGSSISL